MQHLLDLARPYWPLILAVVIWPLVTGALNWWLWWDTPANWDAYVAAHPGRAFWVRALRAAGPHLRKLVVAWRDYAARSSVPPLAGIALPAEKQGALDVSATRAPEPPHPTPPDGVAFDAQRRTLGAVTVDPRKSEPPFDPHARQTVVPPQRDDGQRGSVECPSLLACIVVAIVAGALLVGCPTVIRDPVIAPPPAPADAGATACHNGAPWRFTAGAWSQADRQCNRLSTDASAVVCCATPSALRSDASVHACVPMARCSPQ